MKRFILCAVGALVFSSCEKVIEPGDLPEQDARLVINAILKADTVVNVYLSSSKSIISGKDYKTVDNAFCAVYEDDVFLEQLSFKTKGNYVGTKKPVAGKRYKVVARAGGFADADGASTMPSVAVVNRVQRTDSLNGGFYMTQGQNANANIYGGISFKIYLKETAGVPDYYAIGAQLLLYDTLGGLIPHVASIGLGEGSLDYYFGGNNLLLYSDEEGVVGGERIINIAMSANDDISQLQLPKIGKVELVLLTANISSEYYKYITTAQKQASTSASFFAEPTIIYSNCNNGMGIVGSANYSPKVIYTQKIK